MAGRPHWLRELAADVAQVYHAMPENERQNTVIISTNYGEAGALELYGPEFGLPTVFATHNSFHSWGPPPDSVRTYIGVMIDIDDARPPIRQCAGSKSFSLPGLYPAAAKYPDLHFARAYVFN